MKKRILFGVISFTLIGIGLYTTVTAKCCTYTVQAKAPSEILSSEELFKNTQASALPQTKINAIVTEFLKAPLPEGKKEKKVLVLGYDGFRFDALEALLQDTNTSLKDVGLAGGLYVMYAGGEEESLQETSTAPGWASILTGAWSDQTQVYDNEDEKSSDTETFLMSMEKIGYTSAYISSWAPHFDTTYRADIEQIQKEGLPISYVQTSDDADTLQTTLNFIVDPDSLEKADAMDLDIVFTIFEYSDHEGHTSGFSTSNPAYMKACRDADSAGKQILEAVENRKNYEQEDWLILITSDHGGTAMGSHGGQSEGERTTWLAINQALPLQ